MVMPSAHVVFAVVIAWSFATVGVAEKQLAGGGDLALTAHTPAHIGGFADRDICEAVRAFFANAGYVTVGCWSDQAARRRIGDDAP